MGELDGRVALITGGGSGIGLGVASALVDAGCKVALMGRTAAQFLRFPAFRDSAGWLTQP